MKGRRGPLVICLLFAVVGLVLVVVGPADARLTGAACVLFFGLGALALAPPLLTRRGPGTVRIVEAGAERGFLFPLARGKQLILLVACVGMTAGSVLLIAIGPAVAGVLGALTFGTCTVFAALQLTRERGLLITPTRVVIVSLGREELAWEEIAAVGLYGQGPNRLLGLEAVPAARGRGGRFTRFNRGFLPAEMVVAADQLSGPPERVVEALAGYLEQPERRAAIGTEAELARVM